jgi:uncharacterized RDD family membrane protein YckC
VLLLQKFQYMDYQDQTDLLQEEQNELGFVDPAPWGLRLVNYIIDQLVMGVFVNIVTGALGIARIAGANPKGNILVSDQISSLLIQLPIVYGILVLYYTISETAMNGRTLGKLATGTIAITQDGTPFTFKHALVRSLCRIIPFEAFSALGYMPWHDSLSKTAVVKKNW